MPQVARRKVKALTKSVNTVLRDEALVHSHYMQRFSNTEVKSILRFLNDDMVPDLANKLDQRLKKLKDEHKGPDPGSWTTNWMRETLASTDEILQSGLDSAGEYLHTSLRNTAADNARWQNAVLGQVTKPYHIQVNMPNVAHLQMLVSQQPFQGMILRDWWGKVTTASQNDLARQLAIGVAQGETNRQIVSRILGTSSQAFRDGTVGKMKRDVESTVRTAINHAGSLAREQTYIANDDIIAGVQYIATLDGRTTLICIGLDGKVFAIGEGPRPPQHYGCRSDTAPVLKSWKQLGIDLKEAPPGTRASMNGEVADEVTYGTWLKEQPEAFQRKVLGRTRAQLFNEGKINVDQFVNDKNRTLTLDELRSLAESRKKSPAVVAFNAPLPEGVTLSGRIRQIYRDDPGIHWKDIQSIVSKEFPDSNVATSDVLSVFSRKQKAALIKAGEIQDVPMRKAGTLTKPPVVVPKLVTPPPPPTPIKGATEVFKMDAKRVFEVQTLTEADRASMLEYQAGTYKSQVGGYSTLQDYLRDGKIAPWLVKEEGVTAEKIQKVIQGVDVAISKSTASEEMSLLRGIREPAKVFQVKDMSELKVGYEFVDKGYTSATTSKDVVERFSTKLNRWDDPKVLHIRVKKGQKAFPMDLVEKIGEREVVLPRGTKFRVTLVSGNNIYLEVVENAEVIPAKMPAVTSVVESVKVTPPPVVKTPKATGTRPPAFVKDPEEAISVAKAELDAIGLNRDALEQRTPREIMAKLAELNKGDGLCKKRTARKKIVREAMGGAMSGQRATLSAQQLKVTQKAVDELLEVIPDNLIKSRLVSVKWQFRPGRSRANFVSNTVELNSNPGANLRGSIWHEFAHHLEFLNKKVDRRARKWGGARTRGKKATEVVVGDHTEIFIEDSFFVRYVGRDYRYLGKKDLREITSMGMDAMSAELQSPVLNWGQMLEKDPDHFYLMWATLRGY